MLTCLDGGGVGGSGGSAVTAAGNADFHMASVFVEKSTDFNGMDLSLGLDIETGGHVFQLHITNSMPMHESGFMTRTQSDWFDGGVHFGFNISREFNL